MYKLLCQGRDNSERQNGQHHQKSEGGIEMILNGIKLHEFQRLLEGDRCSKCEEQAQDGFDLCRVCMEKFMVEESNEM